MKLSLGIFGTSSILLADSLTSHQLQDGFFDSFFQVFGYITKANAFQKINVAAFVLSLMKIAYSIYKKKKSEKKITTDVYKKNNSLFEKLVSLESPVENSNKLAGTSDDEITKMFNNKELSPIDYHDSVQYRALKSSFKGFITEFNFDSDVTAIMAESKIGDHILVGHLAVVDESFDMIDMHKSYKVGEKIPDKNSAVIEILKENCVIPAMTANSHMIECKIQPSRKYFGYSCGIIPTLMDNFASVGLGLDVNGSLRYNSISSNLYCLTSKNSISRLGVDCRGLDNVAQIGIVAKSIESLECLFKILIKRENRKIDPTGFFPNQTLQQNDENKTFEKLKIGYIKTFNDNTPEYMIESQNRSISNVINFLSSKGHILVEVKCDRPSKIFKDYLMFMKSDPRANNDYEKFSKIFLKTWSDVDFDFIITPISNIALPKNLNKETLQYSHDFLSIANRCGLSAATMPLYKINQESEISDQSSVEGKAYQDELKDSIGLYSGVQILSKAYDETKLIKVMKLIKEMN